MVFHGVHMRGNVTVSQSDLKGTSEHIPTTVNKLLSLQIEGFVITGEKADNRH